MLKDGVLNGRAVGAQEREFLGPLRVARILPASSVPSVFVRGIRVPNPVEGPGRTRRFRLATNPGLALAGIWFILTGLFGLFGFAFQGQALVMALLALIAGVLLFFGR